jgi:hypothetical protein
MPYLYFVISKPDNMKLYLRLSPVCIILVFIMSSCQEDPATSYDEELYKTEEVDPACHECFEPEGPWIERSFQTTVWWGGPTGRRFNRTIDVMAFNTMENFVFRIRSSHSMADIMVKFPDEEPFSIKSDSGVYPEESWIEKKLALPQTGRYATSSVSK